MVALDFKLGVTGLPVGREVASLQGAKEGASLPGAKEAACLLGAEEADSSLEGGEVASKEGSKVAVRCVTPRGRED